ncbi:hypothetical protein PQX77_003635, partial [Marasmius sp. AFHP31]
VYTHRSLDETAFGDKHVARLALHSRVSLAAGSVVQDEDGLKSVTQTKTDR